MAADSGLWAKVLAVHPEAHAVDLIMLTTGARYAMAPVLSHGVSTNTGSVDLPTPTPPADAYGVKATKDRDVYAAVLMFGGRPAVVGFKVPESCQMTFKDPGLKVTRHGSDFYSTVDSEGNFELYHPSGTFLTIGTSNAHRDLTGQDFDKLWKIDKNTDKAVHVHLSVGNAGSEVASLDIDPSGNMTGNMSGTGALTFAGNLTVKAPTITFDTPTAHFTGNVNVDGAIVSTGDVTGDGTSLHTHIHGGVQTGSGNTAAPV